MKLSRKSAKGEALAGQLRLELGYAPPLSHLTFDLAAGPVLGSGL